MNISIKRLKLYLETSVWNFVYADDSPDKRDFTKQFFKEVAEGRHEVFISDLVSAEIEDAPKDIRDKLMALLQQYAPQQLIWNEEVDRLADAYLKAKAAPQKSQADMIHVAHAVVHNMDVILSWNLRHIVRLKARLAINGVNKMMGYREIEIETPEEVIDYGTA